MWRGKQFFQSQNQGLVSQPFISGDLILIPGQVINNVLVWSSGYLLFGNFQDSYCVLQTGFSQVDYIMFRVNSQVEFSAHFGSRIVFIGGWQKNNLYFYTIHVVDMWQKTKNDRGFKTPSEQIKGINSNEADGLMVLVRVDMNLQIEMTR